MDTTFVVISGCSGGGKSTLLGELARQGYPVVGEPGRRIVRDELARGGHALPWKDGEAFARRVIEVAVADRQALSGRDGWVFFDRSVIDAAAYLEVRGDTGILVRLARRYRYHRRVFLAPPWAELFNTDRERRHDFREAIEEYDRLRVAYPAAGYRIVTLPKLSVSDRARFVLAALEDDA